MDIKRHPLKRLKADSRMLLIAMLFLCLCPASAQRVDTEEARLERAVSVYYEGTNEYELYKAISDYRKLMKAKGDMRKYYETWEKEINYDVMHNHYRNGLMKTEKLKNELKEAKAEDCYYMVDYLMGVFYGMREENVLSKEHLLQAAKLADPEKDHEALLQIYLTLANICIFESLEEGLEGYIWADKAIGMSETPEELCSSLSLKAMVAFGHYDKGTFDKCYADIEKIRRNNPDIKFLMYRRYVDLGRAAYDGDYEKAVAACDSISDEVGRLYFQAAVYHMKGDLQHERDVLLDLLKAKDRRNNEISSLTVDDINQDLLLEQQRLSARRVQMYERVAIATIIAITIVVLVIITNNRKKRSERDKIVRRP